MRMTHGLTCLLFFALPVQAAEPTAAPAQDAPRDTRILAEMPPTAQALMRQDMLDHLAALNAIVAALGKNELKVAADIAEQQLGRASMGKHRGTGMGPGRFMPTEMRNIGWGMHEAADKFASEARSGNAPRAYAALQAVTSACVSCHAIYRTR